MTEDEANDLLRAVFMPVHMRELEAISGALARGESPRFAYYTTADTAAKILKNREVWMRMPSTMNDYSEVEHGFACLQGAWNSDAGGRLMRALGNIEKDIVATAAKQFDDSQVLLRRASYITSVSRHHAHEDKLGRLSMWRAYGGAGGVALIFKGDPFVQASDDCGYSSSPVVYGDQSTVQSVFDEMARNVTREAAHLRTIDPALVAVWLKMALQYGVLCVKHPAFAEELEWRIIHVDGMDTENGLETRNETIRGTPQIVKAIKLEDPPKGGMQGISIPNVLERVIIGPTEHAHATYVALHDLLRKCGVEDVNNKLVVSGIPLRMTH